MDVYALFKFLHVMAALAWVGGGMTMLASAIFAVQDHGEIGAIKAAGQTASLGKRWFVPASLATLVLGAVTTTVGGLWGESWIILALLGAATTFLTGMFVLEPRAKEMGRLMGEGREAEAAAVGRRLLTISKFDYTIMVLIVADMVLKPYWTDFLTLGAMAAVLAAGAALFLVLPKRASEPRMA